MKSAGRVRRHRALGVATGCLILVSGCRDADRAADDPRVTEPTPTSSAPAPPETTTTTGLVPLDQDPPVIDLAYAQRVLDQISHLDGEASRILYREKSLTPEVETLIQTYLDGEALEGLRRGFQADLSVGLETYRDPPGDPIVTAQRIVRSGAGCIALLADSDFAPRYRRNVDRQKGIAIVVQRNLEPTPAERRLNPSNWIQTLGGTLAAGKSLDEVCS